MILCHSASSASLQPRRESCTTQEVCIAAVHLNPLHQVSSACSGKDVKHARLHWSLARLLAKCCSGGCLHSERPRGRLPDCRVGRICWTGWHLLLVYSRIQY